MIKFAHLADVHLGGWRQEELQKLNFKTFQKVVERIIEERVDFVLVAGDLFDSAYPPIEILKESFAEFKKIHDAKIPVYLIAGSHDFSASGKTFLDVLEKAGFCKNVENWELQDDGRIKLLPTFHQDIAIYGYPGRKSGLDVNDLHKVYFDSVYAKTIFMLHTTIKDVVGNLPMDYIEKEKLPLANYYALGHIHKRYESKSATSAYAYPGPTYPNNFQELVDLKYGSFILGKMDGADVKVEHVVVPVKEVIHVVVNLDNGLTATQEVIKELDKLNLNDKVVLLRLKGVLKQGKSGDIRFHEIEEFIHKKGAHTFLRNISGLVNEEVELEISTPTDDMEHLEKNIMKEYTKNHPANFNKYLPSLMNALSLEKKEDEKTAIFEDRLLGELKEVLELNEVLE